MPLFGLETNGNTRTGLTLTARTEARISSYLTERPSSSGNTAVTTLKQEVSTLATAAEKDKSSLEDVFQAKVCLVWMDSILEDHNKVLSTLSAQEIDQAIGRFTNIVSPTARSTHVCIVRGAYLRGTYCCPLISKSSVDSSIAKASR